MKKNFLLVLLAYLLFSFVSCTDPNNSDLDLRKDYKVTIKISSDDDNNINAWVYDENQDFYNDAIISVDDLNLVKQSGDNYFVYENSTWADGSSHRYSIEIPDVGSANGEIVKPSGTLTGVTYSPDSSAAYASSYTISPPSGGWPEGSYIECHAENNGAHYLYTSDPQGSDSVIFDGDKLSGASIIVFSTALKETVELSDFKDGSVVTIIGRMTNW